MKSSRLKFNFAAFFLVFAMFTPSASACMCGWGGAFLDVAQNSELIVFGKVKSYQSNSLYLEVIEILRGKDERKLIQLWGDNGAQCLQHVENFPVGTKWVFALNAIVDNNPEAFSTVNCSEGSNKTLTEPKAKYELSICGEYSLQLVGDFFQGVINDRSDDFAKKKMSLSQLRNLIDKWH